MNRGLTPADLIGVPEFAEAWKHMTDAARRLERAAPADKQHVSDSDFIPALMAVGELVRRNESDSGWH
jgi:hypothetical protein